MLKQNRSLYKTKLNNNRGMTIVEVLVAAGLAAIVSLGIATMLQNMFIEHKRAVLFSTFTELKTRIESNIRDQGSWAQTLADTTNNPTLACFAANTTCTAVYTPPTAATKIVLRDAAGNIAFNLLDWSSTGTNGFTEGGAGCSTFSATAGAGVDACPISYRLVVNMWCPSSTASCRNPQIKITGRLIFNPSTTGILNRFRNLVPVGNLTSTVSDIVPDQAKYDIMVKRTAVATNVSFKIAMLKAGGGSPSGIQNCGTEGAGTCSVGSYAVHPMLWTETAGDDPENLVTVNGGGQSITFNTPAPYSCTITVPAFATSGFTAQLWNSTDSVSIATASTVAGLWGQSVAVIDTKFVAGASKTYQLRQKCQSLPPVTGGYDPANCSLGMHLEPYTGDTEIVTMTCYRIDKVL